MNRIQKMFEEAGVDLEEDNKMAELADRIHASEKEMVDALIGLVRCHAGPTQAAHAARNALENAGVEL